MDTRHLLEPALVHEFRRRTPDERRDLAADLLAGLGGTLRLDIIDRLASALTGDAERPAPAAHDLLDWAVALPETANASALRARVAAIAGDTIGTADAWARCVGAVPRPDPMLRLEYAQALERAGRTDGALAQIRLALAAPPKYAFFPRAQALVAALAESAPHARGCRVALLGTRTTSLLGPMLTAYALRDRVRLEIYQGLYGAVEQEVLDDNSGLARFRPDIVFLMSHWRDLQLPAIADDPDALVDRVVGARASLWRTLVDRFGCHVVQFGADYPADEPAAYLAASLRGGRASVIASINRALYDAAPAGVSILDAASVQRNVGPRWQDPMLWFTFQQHPSTDALPELADLMAAHVRAVLGLTRKVLVTDLDNTLWKGIIGEDGLDGIQVGPGSPAGEACAILQDYLLDLKARGVLLAVCSKNNPDDARLPFLQHPGMKLRLEDFAAFRANWDEKASNLQAIAQELSLGLDSVVFLDDNPMEREWIRSQHPEVAVVDLGPSPLHYVGDLDRGRYFFALTLSDEDRARAAQYGQEAARRELQASAASLDDFLAGLDMQAAASPVSRANLARVTQLINKTNQFNLTSRRYTEAQVAALAADPDGWASAFHLSDRMGDYGLIGVLICRGDGSAAWEIDTWLMSCRALGRQMDRYMFDRLVEAAAERGIRRIVGVYKPTARNGQVASLFDHLGFTRLSDGGGESRFVLDVPARPARTATHIRDLGAPRAASEAALA